MGQSLLSFLVAVVGLGAIGVILFQGLDAVARDETFKKIAKVAIGAALAIVFILAAGAVLFGVGAAPRLTPNGLLELGIGLVVVLVVLKIVYLLVDEFLPSDFRFKEIVLYVIGAVAVIALLILAERALFGGGLGLINFQWGIQPLVK